MSLSQIKIVRDIDNNKSILSIINCPKRETKILNKKKEKKVDELLTVIKEKQLSAESVTIGNFRRPSADHRLCKGREIDNGVIRRSEFDRVTIRYSSRLIDTGAGKCQVCPVHSKTFFS